MTRLIYSVIFAVAALCATASLAQNTSYIQVEAHQSLREAQTRARAFSGAFDNVVGFGLGNGWYGVLLGPFSAQEAEKELRLLKRDNLIPGDSYIAKANSLRQRYWPAGADIPATAAPIAETTPPPLAPPVQLADETPREARASEKALSKDERKELQTALQWEGFYTSSIDGSFGKGTRRSMAAYQTANGYEPTGILTSQQRNELLVGYNSFFAALGLGTIRDEEAGIEITIPKSLVNFEKYEAPFAHFAPADASGVRVLLISQPGDQATLFGLYDIMQTLAIVPSTGERNRDKNSFVLTGQNSEISSYTYAARKGNLIKGFTLVWPAGDEKRMKAVVDAMRNSFEPFGDYALDETLGASGTDQSIDLLAGIEIRKPKLARSGFFVDGKGHVVTAAQTVASCARITLDDSDEAEVIFQNDRIALLAPKTALAPLGVARFAVDQPRLNSDVAVSGFSYQGALGAPSVTFGTLADVRGLKGETDVSRLAITAETGDAGGPVFDGSGAVIGMLTPRDDAAQKLPLDVNYALHAAEIAGVLASNGVALPAAQSTPSLAPEDIARMAVNMTVLVGCWGE